MGEPPTAKSQRANVILMVANDLSDTYRLARLCDSQRAHLSQWKASEMETFTAIKDFVPNPHFNEQRRKALNKLDFASLDRPIVGLLRGFARLAYCFTLQSCHGHFLYGDQEDTRNIEPLPVSTTIPSVKYRIAYIALCLQGSDTGKALFQDLSELPSIDPEYIQFGCAEWFWKRQVNSFALQVEPKRYQTKDWIVVDYREARHIEKVRDEFFDALGKVIQKRVQDS